MVLIQYVGSKNKLSKELAPIIQSYINKDTVAYIEPLVGGANMIDKITHHNKIGLDIHKELIDLLQYAQKNELPQTITRKEYEDVRNNKEKYPTWYVGLVGFCGSFGAKYFGGFATGNDERDRPKEAINNIRKQSKKPNFQNVKFKKANFLDLSVDEVKNSVIYCDPPYANTTKYKSGDFPHDEFYEWCRKMSEYNIVLVSEYDMPSDFECIWQKETVTTLGSGVNTNSDKKRVEKLYVISNV